MTDKELKKYTVDFINNETGSNRSNIDFFMGRMLIKYAEVFQNRIKELERFIKTQDRKLRQQSEECDKAINRVETLVKENAELQQKWLNEIYEKAKLVEKWKHNGENIIQVCKDIEGAKTYYEHQLTKAKELLKEFCTYYMYDCDETRKDYEMFEKLKEQAEQFINSGVEK